MLRSTIGRPGGSPRRAVAGATALLALPAGLLVATAPPSAAATPAAVTTATGDARSVSQPSVPSTVCSTISSGLQMASRKSGTTQEAAPPDTSRIQAALNSCTQSGSTPVAVKLVAGDSTHAAFLSGPLTIPAGVVLLLDSNVTLYASLNAANYQVSGASATCGTVSANSGGCHPFITVSGANAGIEGVRASSGTQGRIDGRGDLDLYGTSTSWFDLAATAKSESLTQNNPRLIQANNSNNFTLFNIDLLNAANFHVVYENGTGFTAWGVRIKTPATAGNTDGIDPAGATNVTIANSYIMDGDDGVAVKAGSASKNITIENDHFYGTHGISIGSETNGGLTNMLVENNTITGVDANGAVGGSPIGLRIKSDSAAGGAVNTVSYLNNCVTQVKQPLVFDTRYNSSTGSLIPTYTNILVNGLKSSSSMSGSGNVINGYDSSHLIGLTLENVSLDKTTTTAAYATVGLYNSNLTPSGTGVTTSSVSGSGSVPSCSFPTYPAL